MSEEKMQFQAEVGKILDIVVNALYSDTDIFLRIGFKRVGRLRQTALCRDYEAGYRQRGRRIQN